MATQQQEILMRLRRIEGQLRGIQKMVEEQRPCDQVLAQIMSARTALDGAATQVVTAFVDECVATRPPEEMRREVVRAVKLLSRVS